MYKIVTKEDTIRIPAEYIRKDKSLDQHIDRLAATAFEGRFDDDNRFILVTSNHQPLGRGRIIHGDGAIYQEVRFDAVLFCMEDYEVVEGAVSEVNDFGAFVRIGPMGLCFTSLRLWKTMLTLTLEWALLKVDKVDAALVWAAR
jgi:DNA-directed RNA polymerase subunit E'